MIVLACALLIVLACALLIVLASALLIALADGLFHAPALGCLLQVVRRNLYGRCGRSKGPRSRSNTSVLVWRPCQRLQCVRQSCKLEVTCRILLVFHGAGLVCFFHLLSCFDLLFHFCLPWFVCCLLFLFWLVFRSGLPLLTCINLHIEII